MGEGESLLRLYAEEIEADLGLRGIDIGRWHRGEMSDRQLLVLVRGLPENSAFKTAWRDGDWSYDRYVNVAILNELRALRADLRVLLHSPSELTFDPLLSPRQEADHQDWMRSAKTVYAQIIAQIS